MLSVSAAAAGLTQFKLGYNRFVVLKACLRPAASQSLWEMQILTLLPDPLNQYPWGGSRLLYFHQPFRVFCTWTFENHPIISLSLLWEIVSSLQKSCKNNAKNLPHFITQLLTLYIWFIILFLLFLFFPRAIWVNPSHATTLTMPIWVYISAKIWGTLLCNRRTASKSRNNSDTTLPWSPNCFSHLLRKKFSAQLCWKEGSLEC